jgi:hypothetical protein
VTDGGLNGDVLLPVVGTDLTALCYPEQRVLPNNAEVYLLLVVGIATCRDIHRII